MPVRFAQMLRTLERFVTLLANNYLEAGLINVNSPNDIGEIKEAFQWLQDHGKGYWLNRNGTTDLRIQKKRSASVIVTYNSSKKVFQFTSNIKEQGRWTNSNTKEIFSLRRVIDEIQTLVKTIEGDEEDENLIEYAFIKEIRERNQKKSQTPKDLTEQSEFSDLRNTPIDPGDIVVHI